MKLISVVLLVILISKLNNEGEQNHGLKARINLKWSQQTRHLENTPGKISTLIGWKNLVSIKRQKHRTKSWKFGRTQKSFHSISCSPKLSSFFWIVNTNHISWQVNRGLEVINRYCETVFLGLIDDALSCCSFIVVC